MRHSSKPWDLIKKALPNTSEKAMHTGMPIVDKDTDKYMEVGAAVEAPDDAVHDSDDARGFSHSAGSQLEGANSDHRRISEQPLRRSEIV